MNNQLISEMIERCENKVNELNMISGHMAYGRDAITNMPIEDRKKQTTNLYEFDDLIEKFIEVKERVDELVKKYEFMIEIYKNMEDEKTKEYILGYDRAINNYDIIYYDLNNKSMDLFHLIHRFNLQGGLY